MKKWVFLLLGLGVWQLSAMAQDDDDLYFVPTKANVAKQKASYGIPQDTYWEGSSRSSDEYNRRLGSNYEVLPADTGDVVTFAGVEGVYPDSIEEFSLTRKMQKWDDYEPSEEYWEGYAKGRKDARGSWSWHSPWYYSSFYPWYDYGWYDSWYYDRWYGWYDPWYAGWGWGGYYNHWWYRPSWYYGWYGGGYYGAHHYYGGNYAGRSGTRNHGSIVSGTGNHGYSDGRSTRYAGGRFTGSRQSGSFGGSRQSGTSRSTPSRSSYTPRSASSSGGSSSSWGGSRSSSSSTRSSSMGSSSSSSRSSGGGSFGGSRSGGGGGGGRSGGSFGGSRR